MIEVRQVHHHAQQSTHDAHARGFEEAHILLLDDGINQEGNDHQQDDKQIVVGHLHVVGIHFHRCKQGRHDEAPHIFPSIGQHNTANHRRQIGQGHHLPQVAGSDDNEEIGAEGPQHRTQCSQVLTEVEGSQQDIEAQQIDKQIPHIVGQPQVIGLLDGRQR